MDKIITSDSLIETEQHFRISAGPGAGKTHWIVNHIRNVLHNSDRLSNSKKIACITYTNVAANTIMSRLSNSCNSVVVSTIHSFLYKYVVKPYLRFIANDYGIDIKKVDGHDDTILSGYNFIEELKQSTRQQRIRDNNAIVEAISKARWRFIDGNTLEIKPDYPIRVDGYSISNATYWEYRKMAWARGILHHDDVLFFSYQLIMQYPYILNVLRAKFPYFFVDEFQDSNPIQVKILNLIGQEETVVGVIGDKAQSIYGFQGADPLQFDGFSLEGIIDFFMVDNRRSTNEIIDFLNHIRLDFKQNKFKQQSGDKPLIIFGEKIDNFTKCKDLIGGEHLCTLSRTNIVSNIMKREVGVNAPSDLFKQIGKVDSDSKRRRVICSFVKAVEYAKNLKYKEALKEIKSLKKIEPSYKEIKNCLIILQNLLNNHDNYKNSTLKEFIEFINLNIISLTRPTRGKTFEIYNSNSYQQLAVCVNIIEDNSFNRTIHKAKGDEFDNVMLILESEVDLKFISEPDLTNEEHRIMYVAASRAKKKLFISVPEIRADNKIFNLIDNIISI